MSYKNHQKSLVYFSDLATFLIFLPKVKQEGHGAMDPKKYATNYNYAGSVL